MRTARRVAAGFTAVVLLVGLGPTAATASATSTPPTQEAAPSPTAEPTAESAPKQELAAPEDTTVTPEPQEVLPAAQLSTEEPAAAQAADPLTRVVGLGDSYASGEGTFNYDPSTNRPGTNECHRSPQSWQRLATIPGATNVQRTQVACSGAVAADITTNSKWTEGPQLTELQRVVDEDVVLLSIGGNDLGFSTIVTDCATNVCLTTPQSVTALETKINDVVAPAIRSVFTAVLQNTPTGAQVVLAGYPQLVQGTACRNPIGGAFYEIDADEGAKLDRLSVVLRRETVEEVMKLRLQGKPVRYVDTIDRFKGHGACIGSSQNWINGVIAGDLVGPERFHPNPEGYRQYAAEVTETLSSGDAIRCTTFGCTASYQDELVAYTTTEGLLSVSGAIKVAYEAAGGATGPLGYPVRNADQLSQGRSQQFQGGTVYWKTGAAKAFWVGGKFLTKYVATGQAPSVLGYPTSNAYANTGGTGQSQQFEFGLMLLKNGAAQAFWTKGAIKDKYASTGYERGYLGYPTTDHACGLQPDNACRQHFDGSGDSVVYWTSATGAHSVTGYFRDYYASTGWQNSRPDPTTIRMAGYPTSDRYRPPGGTADLQDFEGGIMAGVGGRACWGVPDSDVCFPPAPPPKTVSNAKVGTIVGAYARAPQRDYGGYAYPAEDVGQCVVVERKTASGSWTSSGVTTGSPDRCNLYAWGIAVDAAVSDTVAIRLRVSSGPNAPNSYVNLCSSKTECLAM